MIARILVVGALLLGMNVSATERPTVSREQTVRAFIAAFNAHDTAQMATFVTDDVQWLSIDGNQVSLETAGKDALIKAMDDYFRSCPTCQSELGGLVSSRDRVSALEVASWQGKDGLKSQRGLSVYEFADDLISRVYYFPAER